MRETRLDDPLPYRKVKHHGMGVPAHEAVPFGEFVRTQPGRDRLAEGLGTRSIVWVVGHVPVRSVGSNSVMAIVLSHGCGGVLVAKRGVERGE